MLITSPKVLASLLRDERQKKKLSQSDLWEIIELRQKTVSDFENAPDGARLKTLFKLLAVLDLQLHIETSDGRRDAGWSDE